MPSVLIPAAVCWYCFHHAAAQFWHRSARCGPLLVAQAKQTVAGCWHCVQGI